jgi:hypothetical protein
MKKLIADNGPSEDIEKIQQELKATSRQANKVKLTASQRAQGLRSTSLKYYYKNRDYYLALYAKNSRMKELKKNGGSLDEMVSIQNEIAFIKINNAKKNKTTVKESPEMIYDQLQDEIRLTFMTQYFPSTNDYKLEIQRRQDDAKIAGDKYRSVGAYKSSLSNP